MRQPQPPKAVDALAEELCILFSNYYQDLSAKDKDNALKNYVEDNKTALLQMIFLCSARNKLSKDEVVDGLLFFRDVVRQTSIFLEEASSIAEEILTDSNLLL
jgi:hypothetical protein